MQHQSLPARKNSSPFSSDLNIPGSHLSVYKKSNFTRTPILTNAEGLTVQAKLRRLMEERENSQKSEAVSQKGSILPAELSPPGRIARKGHHVENSIQQRQTSESEATGELESGIREMKGGGRPLDSSERTFFEDRFGHDFSGVRVHTNERANSLANSIQAKAFTVGNDIAFAKGEYAPESASGKHLIAHELGHVVQQGGGEIARRSPAPDLSSLEIASVSSPNGGTEHIKSNQLRTGNDHGGGYIRIRTKEMGYSQSSFAYMNGNRLQNPSQSYITENGTVIGFYKDWDGGAVESGRFSITATSRMGVEYSSSIEIA